MSSTRHTLLLVTILALLAQSAVGAGVGHSTADERPCIDGRPNLDEQARIDGQSYLDEQARIDRRFGGSEQARLNEQAHTEPAGPHSATAITDSPERPPAETALDAGGTPNDTAGPRILAVYPNPVVDGDSGEFVRLHLPPGNWTLGDETASVTVTGPGRVIVTNDPAALRAGPAAVRNDTRIVRGKLGLANGGGRLVVTPAETNRTAAVVVYRDAPAGKLLDDRDWRPVGLEHRQVVGVGAANGTAFVLPDSPTLPVSTLRGADERILLAAYTFSSERVFDRLTAAAKRGVRVRVLVEGGPVGGISQRQAKLLSRLAAANVSVRVVAGPAARVQYHHAKYAVVDDRVLVMTENWKPSGTGGHKNRGWGLRLSDRRVATRLAAVFRADWAAHDTVPWTQFRRGRTFEPADPATESYPTRIEPASFAANATYLLTAPGNAGRGVVSVIDTADSRISVIQPTVSRGPPLRALKRAAERGVRVRLLLSGAWYTAEDNRRLAESLNGWASETGAPLSVRVAESGDAFGAIHAKGLIVDNTVVVGSLNWTPTSRQKNREVALAVRDPTLAAYFREAFAADWGGPDRSLPPELAVVAVGAAALAALFVTRRVSFADVGA